ncbi:MAG: TerC family protein [Gemmatimonadota bacterium]|nr:TerC family protein [Gemmatimonadota bacterium]MDH4347237.1 TerC family protein [Gemmatimonadota bacterium]
MPNLPFLLSLAPAGEGLPPVAWAYAGFFLLVLLFLALDLGVFHREAHEVGMREAVTWTIIWIMVAMAFNGLVYFAYARHWLGLGLNVPQLDGSLAPEVGGLEAARLFLTGYVVEKSLSMDNVFVIALIFSFFAVPARYQHRVLFWGILGALVMRGLMIWIGAALIHQFSWIIYVFGGFLILTAIKMAVMNTDTINPEKNVLIKLVRRLYPVTSQYDGQKFFTRLDGRRAATPLLLALVMVEFTDLVFAVDSIPAIFAITADPFLVLTSNVFAILGLRALYFCLANLIHQFRYLKPALVVVLFFVGVKMMLVNTQLKIDTGISLVVILGTLTLGVVASVVSIRRNRSRLAA